MPLFAQNPADEITDHVPYRPFAYANGTLTCDGIGLEALADKFGTPLYVYSAEQILYRFGLFDQAFFGHSHLICYAVKANSSLAILRMLGRSGSGFDIVSGGELERVRSACPEALPKVVFSGVGKQWWEIDAALQANILLFNVESEAELELLAARAEKLQRPARFALRVNPDVFTDTHPYISTGLREHKFGIEIGKARKLYGTASTSRWLQPTGISVHIGSQIRDVTPFRAALSRVTVLLQELREDGHQISFVDIGGGLGVDYGPSSSFNPQKEIKRYADALEWMLPGLNATLLLEPGRFVVAQAGGLLTSVLYVKQNGSKTFLITDAGMNDLIRPSLYQAHHEILPVREASEERQRIYDVVGPVCESGDFFARDRSIGEMRAGELAVLLDAGAYGMSLASNYNTRPRPAEILVEDGVARLIRRRETIEDLLSLESVES